MKKRIAAILTALALCVSVCACEKKTDETTKATKDTTEVTTTEKEETTTTEEETTAAEDTTTESSEETTEETTEESTTAADETTEETSAEASDETQAGSETSETSETAESSEAGKTSETSETNGAGFTLPDVDLTKFKNDKVGDLTKKLEQDGYLILGIDSDTPGTKTDAPKGTVGFTGFTISTDGAAAVVYLQMKDADALKQVIEAPDFGKSDDASAKVDIKDEGKYKIITVTADSGSGWGYVDTESCEVFLFTGSKDTEETGKAYAKIIGFEG